MRKIAVLCVALGLAAPVMAQDGSETSAARTPENAQRFLSVLAEQYPLKLTTTWQWQHANLEYNARITPQDRCETVFNGNVSRFFVRMNDGSVVQPDYNAPDYAAASQALFDQRQDLVQQVKIKTGPFAVDWAKVSSVGYAQIWNQSTGANTPYKAAVAIATADTWLVITAPSEELAGRMLFAMETLKKACDKTEGLGF